MPGLQPQIVGLCCALSIAAGTLSGAGAQPVANTGLPTPRSVGSALAVTLDRLSVRVLRADRPWDPRVCIGCDLNNGRAPTRHVTGRLR